MDQFQLNLKTMVKKQVLLATMHLNESTLDDQTNPTPAFNGSPKIGGVTISNANSMDFSKIDLLLNKKVEAFARQIESKVSKHECEMM